MKAVYFLFLLAALIFTDTTPVNAKPSCCVDTCVFDKSRPFMGVDNQFNGFLKFMSEGVTTLIVSGFLDVDNIPASYIVSVADCDTAGTPTPGRDPSGNSLIDLSSEPLDAPIRTTRNIIDTVILVTKCCFVVDDTNSILGIAPIEHVLDCTI